MPESALIIDGELVLYGYVGDNFFFDGFTARQVVEALAELGGEDVTVRINSGGGSAWDGVAIYNSLKSYAGEITVKVDAIAASAASIIAMAGDQVLVPASATLMIHNSSGLTMGNAEAHLKTAEVLERLDGQMADIYAARADLDRDAVLAMMAEETWLTGTEAVEQGFADEAPDEDQPEASAFAYQLYAHAPEHLRQLGAQLESLRQAQGAADHPATRQPHLQEDTAMPATPKGGDKGSTAKTTTTITLETVTAEHPDIVDALRQEGADAERERILGIEDNALPGHEDLVDTMKRDPECSVADASGRILQAEKAAREQQRQGVKDVEDHTGSVAAAPVATATPAPAPVAQTPDGWRTEYEASAELQEEFASADIYIAFKNAETSGKARRLSRQPEQQSA